MDWIAGMQRSIDYIEAHLDGEIDYEAAARESFSSSYHFQRVFSILCGCTLGEYIRMRRLTLAGAELAESGMRVIDAALKYGYDSPDSFAKAFRQFHGVTPSQARAGAALKSFSRLSIKISLEGGIMDYRIEKKPALVLTGYKRRFAGAPAKRQEQERAFYMETRANQYILKGMAEERAIRYNVMTNFDDAGYDFYIASRLDDWTARHLAEALGEEDAKRFETIELPPQLCLVCETERSEYPTTLFEELRCKAVGEWLPLSDYELAAAPEVNVYHWYRKAGGAVSASRYAELWLPVAKRG